QKTELVSGTVGLAQAQELNELMTSGELDEGQAKILSLKLVYGELSEAIKYAASVNENFASSIDKVTVEATENATATKKYTGEVDKAQNVTDLLNNRFQEGKREAEGFAGGLGVTNGRLIGAGVAMLFVAKKAGEMIDQFKDAALELAEFDVGLALLESRAASLGLDGTFKGLRDDLSLTRKQSAEFFKVFREGALSGVVSVTELEGAAKKLQSTFGGDPTARLEEYVNLLKEIPTLKADLSVSASLDDQAASIFALAQSGKIETVME
ncbi:unnamed protein product, partial [marine sediment metagenome]